jgi:hypothetical protein
MGSPFARPQPPQRPYHRWESPGTLRPKLGLHWPKTRKLTHPKKRQFLFTLKLLKNRARFPDTKKHLILTKPPKVLCLVTAS